MKIKKIAAGILVLLLMLSTFLYLAACEEKPKEPSVEDDKPSAAETSIFTVSYKNTTLELGKDAKAALKKLGDPSSDPKHVASCGEGAGEQWQYTYPSIVLFTVKDGESETIDAVALRDDIAKTGKGITIGSTEAEMTAAYGEPVKQGNKCRYTKDGYTLEFMLDDAGAVKTVEMRVES